MCKCILIFKNSEKKSVYVFSISVLIFKKKKYIYMLGSLSKKIPHCLVQLHSLVVAGAAPTTEERHHGQSVL